MHDAEARAVGALLGSVEGLLERTPGLTRPARIVAILPQRVAGCVPEVLREVVARQREDGGWASVEESLWCLGALARQPVSADALVRGLEWMNARRTEGGGWSMTAREVANYVVSALALSRIPGLGRSSDSDWLECSWREDLGRGVKLTYKGGLYLEAMRCSAHHSARLTEETAAYLVLEQNRDGGFGPWKDHPIGSDPWSTGLSLVGLCAFPQLTNRSVIERAVKWLVGTQLDSGYWPCHFIDEGTAYAYWGLSEALRCLEDD